MTLPHIARRLWHMPILLFLGALGCWAGNTVFTRLTMTTVDISPIQLSFWRTFIGFIIISLFAFSQVRRDWSVIWKNWQVLSFLGITSLVAYNLLLYFGLASGEEAPAASTIASVFPVVIAFIYVVFFREGISPLGILGITLAVTGGLISAFEGSWHTALAFELSAGKLWLLGAVIGYGTYMACVRLRPPNIGDLSFLWVLIFWALMLLILLWLWDSIWRGNTFPWQTPGAVSNLVYVVLAPTLLAPILVNQSIKIGGAQTPGLMMNLLPFIVAVLAALVGIFSELDESLRWYHWLSLTLIIPGVVLIQLKR